MLDRTVAPPFSLPSEFYILEANKHVLKNGLPIYSIHAGNQSLLRIEFIFHTGYCKEIPHGKAFGGKEPYMGTSYFTSKMMSEGMKNFTSKQFYDRLAQFGIFYEVDHEPYHTFFTFYVLKKYLKEVLPLIQELFEKAIFPATEWESVKKLTLQKLKIDLSKNDFIANRIFYETFFGKNHPAGKHIEESIVHQIPVQDLIDFYQEEIKDKLFDVIVAGAADEEVKKIVSDFFENAPLVKPISYSPANLSNRIHSSEPIFIEKSDSVQSSIRMGIKVVPKRHPDYIDLTILNTLLGGYFGSRLMKNIREDKGYTYGISSRLRAYPDEACLIIGTDVKKEYTQPTLDEINKEIKILQTELVAEEELDSIKNYLKGSMLGSIDTAFDLADKFRSIHLHGLGYDYYQKLYSSFDAITSERLLELANQYLKEKEMLTVVVGGR